MNEQFGSFIGTLFQSRTQAHIMHLQSNSYAQHVALQGYYEEILDIIDGLVESYQGRYGIVYGYKMESNVEESTNPITYFEALSKYVEMKRQTITQDSYIQNQVDEVVALISSALYKLKFLK